MTRYLPVPFFILFIFININVLAQGVSVNTSGAAADTSAVLDVSSTTKGMLVPRMNQTERTNIPLPATGLIVYQTDGTAGFYYNAGTPAAPNWVLLISGATGGSSQWTTTGSDIYYNSGGVAIGQTSVTSGIKLDVNGSIQIPAVNDYSYKTIKTKKYKVGAAEMITANPATYTGRIDDGFSSSTINGLNSLWATGGTPGTAAYFIAPVHLPDGATITNLGAHLVKNGGTLQSVVELYRTDGTGYLANSANLIATATTSSSLGFVTTVTAGSINSSFNVIDNSNYSYFIRWSGEQATQNVRFLTATITYTITKAD